MDVAKDKEIDLTYSKLYHNLLFKKGTENYRLFFTEKKNLQIVII